MHGISRIRYAKTRDMETDQKVGKIIFMYFIVIFYVCIYYNIKLFYFKII